MSTEVALQYENKLFHKGQFKKFVLKLCRFLNILPSDGYTFLRQKDQDFEISSKVSVDELENICDIGTTVSRLDFHYNYNIIKLSCTSCSNVLNVLYVINGNMKYSKKLIFFVENILEITRFTEEISKLTDGHRQATPDISSVEKSEVVIEPIGQMQTDLDPSNILNNRSIEPSVEGVIVRFGGKGANQNKETINKRQFLEIEKPVLNLMKQVYDRETENTVGWTLEKYLHQVIQAHCQEIMGYNQ
ncbi:hypothetical protein [Desulfosporosinus sp. OT]|uniref:hypothetical protein n=1 Tax=Desulfosporosinus sp. OT TaxID=913865 RepID=UPI000223B05D|nr:hypothetical protein [Desulfosporosinus sp. OT]EGW40203.1 hypothetical protein DOT_1844 [Desulfosporosinus sp. OT]